MKIFNVEFTTKQVVLVITCFAALGYTFKDDLFPSNDRYHVSNASKAKPRDVKQTSTSQPAVAIDRTTQNLGKVPMINASGEHVEAIEVPTPQDVTLNGTNTLDERENEIINNLQQALLYKSRNTKLEQQQRNQELSGEHSSEDIIKNPSRVLSSSSVPKLPPEFSSTRTVTKTTVNGRPSQSQVNSVFSHVLLKGIREGDNAEAWLSLNGQLIRVTPNTSFGHYHIGEITSSYVRVTYVPLTATRDISFSEMDSNSGED